MTEVLTVEEYKAKMAGKKKRKKTERPEQDLTIAVAEYLEPLSLIHNFWFSHFPNGGYRTSAEAGIFKAMGTKPGPGDFIIIPKGGVAHWIELKVKGGTQSKGQEDFELAMIALGSPYDVAYSIEDVTEILKKWALI